MKWIARQSPLQSDSMLTASNSMLSTYCYYQHLHLTQHNQHCIYILYMYKAHAFSSTQSMTIAHETDQYSPGTRHVLYNSRMLASYAASLDSAEMQLPVHISRRVMHCHYKHLSATLSNACGYAKDDG